MSRKRTAAALMLMAVVAAAGCGGADAPDEQAAVDDTNAMPGHDMSAMGGMAMDAAMMQRHAAEMDSLVNSMRAHVAEMRQAPPSEWHARMTEHAPMVAEMLSVIDRQMREMDMGMNMSDEHMGEMMGMSGEDHRAMIAEVEALRAEVGQLQTAGQADVAARMPAHLDRIEGLLERMAASADHMRM